MNREVKRIATHVNVDLDATVGSCVELIRHDIEPTEQTMLFVPAATQSVDEDTLAVDIQARKHGNSHSYVGAYCADVLPSQIVEEVNEQDHTGRSSNRVPLSLLIAALRVAGLTDLEIVQQMKPMVHGWMLLLEEWKRAENLVERLPRTKIGNFNFLVSTDEEVRGLSTAAQNTGLDGTIYWTDSGCGIVRYSRESGLNLKSLSLDGWFHHPRGFLVCWGSRKSPREMPPPQFGCVDEFVRWLRHQYEFYTSYQ